MHRWDEAPCARISHPREDHIVPLFVAIGAAGNDRGEIQYHEDNFARQGLASTSFVFGR
jgi:aromatic ring-opening dioxygenase catalytic subunit (LigB family)